jgi:hypothetical protein
MIRLSRSMSTSPGRCPTEVEAAKPKFPSRFTFRWVDARSRGATVGMEFYSAE